MSPTKRLETAEQVTAALGDLRRMRILEILVERQASVKELAREINESPQTTNYHTKVLLQAGLIEIVEKREVRGTLEKSYRAVADRFVAGEITRQAFPDFGFSLVQNFLEMARYAAETSEEPVALHVLGVQMPRERVPEFQQRLAELVKDFQGAWVDDGPRYGLIAGVFPIPEDVVLPENPSAILAVEDDGWQVEG